MKAMLKLLMILLVLGLGAGPLGCQKDDEDVDAEETTEQVEREDTTEDDAQGEAERSEE